MVGIIEHQPRSSAKNMPSLHTPGLKDLPHPPPYGKIRQFVKDRPGQESLQPPAHVYIGFGLTVVAKRNTQGMLRAGNHGLPMVGSEDQFLRFALARYVQTHGQKMARLHLDADLLSRSNQIGLAVLILAQDAGKQAHQRLAANARALMPPAAIAPDDHVHRSAILRVPALNRRQALAGAARSLKQ